MRTDVTAVIPAIPPRVTNGRFAAAVLSAARQTHPVESISVEVDHRRSGAAATRSRAAARVSSHWMAFLDDDDLWYPHHVEHLLRHAEATGADMVYPWFDLPVGDDPLNAEGRPFDANRLRNHSNFIPITVLVRSELIHEVGYFEPLGSQTNPCEDWGTWLKLLDAGARIEHLNERTWAWNWHGNNTSGSPTRW